MRFTYSPSADALYVALVDERQVARTVELGQGTQADYDAGGRLVGIEILAASRFYPRAELEGLESPIVWLTLAEAAAEAAKEGDPISPETLRVQIFKKKIVAEKRGRDWVIARHELWNYLENRSPRGRRAEGSTSERRTMPEPDLAKLVAIHHNVRPEAPDRDLMARGREVREKSPRKTTRKPRKRKAAR